MSLRKTKRQEDLVVRMRVEPGSRLGELAAHYGVSIETIRRDLDELSRRGMLVRTYGGAAARNLTREPSLFERDAELGVERDRIARALVDLLQPDDVVLMDAGSTTLRVARELALRRLPSTVLTNSLTIAGVLAPCDATRVIVCPGDVDRAELATVGPSTADFLATYHADWVVIGAGGLAPGGPSDANSAGTWVKRAMLRCAPRRALVADHSKFDRRHMEIVCAWDGLTDLVTDEAPSGALATELRKAGVTVHVAAPAEARPERTG